MLTLSVLLNLIPRRKTHTKKNNRSKWFSEKATFLLCVITNSGEMKSISEAASTIIGTYTAWYEVAAWYFCLLIDQTIPMSVNFQLVRNLTFFWEFRLSHAHPMRCDPFLMFSLTFRFFSFADKIVWKINFKLNRNSISIWHFSIFRFLHSFKFKSLHIPFKVFMMIARAMIA